MFLWCVIIFLVSRKFCISLKFDFGVCMVMVIGVLLMWIFSGFLMVKVFGWVII